MRVFTTSFRDGKSVEEQGNVDKDPSLNQEEDHILNVYSNEEMQAILGFGGAISESSAFVYQSLDAEAKKRFLGACFGNEGLSYRYGRAAIGSCDFSLGPYDGLNAGEMKEVSLANDGRYILPFLQDIEKKTPLSLLMAPWSPPAIWKTNHSRTQGGKLEKKYWADYALYLCHYVQAYRKNGFAVPFLSIQNEPKAAQTWDSCLFSPEEEYLFLRNCLISALDETGLSETKILLFDHNKERLFDWVNEIYRHDEIRPYIAAAGYHWYSGDHFDALRLLKRKYPNLTLVFSEGCNEHSNSKNRSEADKALRYAKEISRGLNAGASMFIDWNILLNHEGGPNYVGNFCDAPIMADASGKHCEFRSSFFALWHYSHFIRPGSKVLGTTRFSDSVEFCSVKDPCGNIVTVIANNVPSPQRVFLRIDGDIYPIDLLGQSIATTVLPPRNEMRR